LGSEPQYLDPHLASSVSAHNVIIALIEGLVSEDPKTLKPYPRGSRKLGYLRRWTALHLSSSEKMPSGATATQSRLTISFIHTDGFLIPISHRNMQACCTGLKMHGNITKGTEFSVLKF
jgi:ABC-type oligopeptide transport system substrate-binding subunit